MSSKSDESSVNLHAAIGNGVHFFSAMLPSLADPQRLITFGPALFARLEKVQAQKRELENTAMGVNSAPRSPATNLSDTSAIKMGKPKTKVTKAAYENIELKSDSRVISMLEAADVLCPATEII